MARRIHPVGTPEDVGFGSYLVQEKFDGLPLTPSLTFRPVSAEVMKIVGTDVGAIAYSAINFATADTREVPISTGPEGSALAATETIVIRDRYPLDRFIYFYALPRPDGRLEPWIREYFHLALSREGQEIVAAEPDSFLPLSAARAAVERRLLDAAG